MSSAALQADFISEVFKAWDTHEARINIIDFSWQYDITDAKASQFVIDLGLTGTINENEFISKRPAKHIY
ncbi:MAG: hypothetical protein HOG41_12805 [Gammaproteobacteria bacterium]|jgi:hypothetical protein|nr:hypothetical protein [Gammaproteobacteria bacterium]MBT7047555.1 hypothetical protein [Gammaproteobacteria bacterium]